MSLESAFLAAEDYKIENFLNLAVWSQREVNLPDLFSPLLIPA